MVDDEAQRIAAPPPLGVNFAPVTGLGVGCAE